MLFTVSDEVVKNISGGRTGISRRYFLVPYFDEFDCLLPNTVTTGGGWRTLVGSEQG